MVSDVYGNDLDSGINGAREPLFFSAYAQDKMEFNDLILKLVSEWTILTAMTGVERS
jgi:hypothetical protein